MYSTYLTIGLILGVIYLLSMLVHYDHKYNVSGVILALYIIICLFIVVMFWPLVVLYLIIRNT